MEEPTSLLRYRASRDLNYVRRRLAELEAAGPYDDSTTLGEVLNKPEPDGDQ